MTTGATGQLGLALPVQGELSGTWGDTVNNGITQYTNIAIAGTLTLTNDGAVTLANTTGDASASNITSTLTGAGTVTAQFAIVRVTGTLTTAKVVTAPSYSKTYVVVNAATGGIVTFKASGQTGVSIAVGESAWVYFNGTDYVKLAGTVNTGVTSFQTSLSGLTPSTSTTGAVTLAGTLGTANGGTGLTSFTSGGVVYASSSSALATSPNLFYDSTNARLGILTTNPQSDIHIARLGAAQSATARLQGNQGSDGEVGVLNFSNRTDITGGYIIGSITVNRSGDDNSGAMLFNTAQGASTPSERMRITPAGYVGIGTSSPSLPLEVVGQARATTLLVRNAGTPTVPVNTTPTFFSPSSGVLGLVNNGVETFRASASGGFSVGTTADPGAGAIYATGNITAYYSDKRLKTVSGKIENALDKVAQLSGVYYTNNSVAKSFGYDSDEVQVGVLAQDVEAVLPQIVKAAPFDLDQDGNSKSGENYKTVQYERLVPLLIEAINELRAEVKALKGA